MAAAVSEEPAANPMDAWVCQARAESRSHVSPVGNRVREAKEPFQTHAVRNSPVEMVVVAAVCCHLVLAETHCEACCVGNRHVGMVEVVAV